MSISSLCNGECTQCPLSECPYPDLPKKHLEKELTYSEIQELKSIEREILFPKTEEQKKRAVRDRRYYESHRDECSARNKKWKAEHKAYVAARDKRYYRTHRGESKARWRRRYQLHREKILAERREWRKNNPDYFRNYYQKNKEKINERYDQNRKRYGPVQSVIRKARLARGWTQKDLAKAMGLHEKTIAYWETGRNPANWDKLCRVMPELEGQRP